MANKMIVCCVCRTNCLRWCCTIFWILSGIILILGAEFARNDKCKTTNILQILFPIGAALFLFLTGLCGRFICVRHNSSCCGCIKVCLTSLFISAGIACLILGYKAVEEECKNHDELVNGLIIGGAAVAFIAGCIAGDLVVRNLYRSDSEYEHI